MSNWLHSVSDELLQECAESCTLEAVYRFHQPTCFSIAGCSVTVEWIAFHLICTVRFVSQFVQPEVSLGHFDHATGRVAVPSKQFYNFGMLDNEAWEETDSCWDDSQESTSGPSFSLRTVLLNFWGLREGLGTPDLSSLIAKSAVAVVDPDPDTSRASD